MVNINLHPVRKQHIGQCLKVTRWKSLSFLGLIMVLVTVLSQYIFGMLALSKIEIGKGVRKREQRAEKNERKVRKGKEEQLGPQFARDYYDVCIVGAGLSGAVIAEQYASQLGQNALVIDKRDHVGGNCYDFVDHETGILVNKYGAHLFHTKYFRVWQYVQQFSEWTPYEHRVLGRVGEKHVPIPVNIDTVNSLFDLKIQSPEQMDEWLEKEQVRFNERPKNSEEMALSRVGNRLYNIIFKPYTIKQWAKTPAQLGPEVTARIPVRNNWDDRYFGDVFQALPTHGYTNMFRKMLDNPLIETLTNVDYFDVRDRLNCGHTYFTGPVDHYFAHLGYEKLEYRSLEFERKVHLNVGENKRVLPAAVVNYPSANYNFTRIVEYKHLLNQTSNHSVLFYEHSNDQGEPYYPVPNQKNIDLFKKYQKIAAKAAKVTFVGWLANYKYFTMDESILNALKLFDSNNPRVVILQEAHCDSGGPEALLQLALAFHSWMPTRTFFYHNSEESREKLPEWYERGYPEAAEVGSIRNTTDLKKGDIYIIPEVFPCPVDLVELGVQVYIFQLSKAGSISEHKVEEMKKLGCKHISHSFFLSADDGLNLSRSHITIPFVRREKTHFGPINNDKRKNLILINQVHAGSKVQKGRLRKYCRARVRKCQVLDLKGFSVTQLKELYLKAKVIVADCLNGLERAVLEAALAGALILTNHCGHGTDSRDLPIPYEHKYSEKNIIENIVERMLSNFEEEQGKLESFRSLYKSYDLRSLVQDTKRFMYNVASILET